MLQDVQRGMNNDTTEAFVGIGDARKLYEPSNKFSAVITSPPYPNRHDYTRVFDVELLFEFLDIDELKQLRNQSFHSHPESRPIRPDFEDYIEPKKLRTRAKIS